MRVPEFVKIQADAFNSVGFVAPIPDSQSQSAYATATSTIRYRKNESTGLLESNTLFNKWSDGSVTISIGDVTYELTSKPLAPTGSKEYNDVLDSHTYLATPYIASQVMQVVGHVTNQYTVALNDNLQDTAIMKLRAAMEKSGRHNDHKDGTALISVTHDPDLQKRQAEQAERERLKSQKRREAANARADQAVGRVRGAIGSGLSLDDLEGRARGISSKKKRPAPKGGRKARRADYDTDDEMPRGRDDEYDLEDDFLAPSDEEQEPETGDESEEEEYEEESHRTKKQKTDAGSEEDAEGEDEDVGAAPSGSAQAGGEGGGRRKRQVIQDDEDDE
jgi:RNA polymerase-associated protein LEO1